MIQNDLLAHGLKSSGKMVEAFCADLTWREMLYRPCPEANCVAWTLGHLIDTDQKVSKRLGATSLPELPENFAVMFSRENDAPKAEDFGDTSILLPLFTASRQRFISTMLILGEDALNTKLEKPTPRYSTIGEMISFMIAHTAMHAGQISLIRRCLGRPPLV